jgi:ABC-type transport system involved in multi-copper enzyme maturation permease subunit
MSAVASAQPAPTPTPRGDSAVAVAARMFAADFLKLRKKRSTLIWALVIGLAPIVIAFAVTAIEHASDPTKFVSPGHVEGYGPAGGIEAFHDGLRLLGGLFFGPLVAILIGVEAGTGDASAGVFRDLVVTGRSRVALFASRIPAALALTWLVVVCGYLLILLGTFVFASNLPTPSGALILNGFGFLLLATGVVCAVAVGFASLTTSKPAAIIALIAWQLVATPLIVSISSLGSARDFVLAAALAHMSPLTVGGGHAGDLAMSLGTALLVIVLWLVVFVGLGAWRTRTIDA